MKFSILNVDGSINEFQYYIDNDIFEEKIVRNCETTHILNVY